MNTVFQLITMIFVIIIILWIIRGAEVFTIIKDKCNSLTMKDCLESKKCKYITSSKDFRINECVNNKKDVKNVKTYEDDDYTRALIANDNLYRNTKVNVFE